MFTVGMGFSGTRRKREIGLTAGGRIVDAIGPVSMWTAGPLHLSHLHRDGASVKRIGPSFSLRRPGFSLNVALLPFHWKFRLERKRCPNRTVMTFGPLWITKF